MSKQKKILISILTSLSILMISCSKDKKEDLEKIKYIKKNDNKKNDYDSSKIKYEDVYDEGIVDKNIIKKLGGNKQIIKKFFKNIKFLKENKVQYKLKKSLHIVNNPTINIKKGYPIQVQIKKTEIYKKDKKEYLLIYFGNENLIAGHPNTGFVSVAKYVRKKSKWHFLKFTKDIGECGYDDWGKYAIPKIKKRGEYYFYESLSSYMFFGVIYLNKNYCELETGKLALKIKSIESDSPSPYSSDYDSILNFNIKNKKLFAIVKSKGIKNCMDFNIKIIYIYNKENKKFEEYEKNINSKKSNQCEKERLVE